MVVFVGDGSRTFRFHGVRESGPRSQRTAAFHATLENVARERRCGGLVVHGYVGSIFHMVPTLCKNKLHSEKLGNFTMWAWNGVMVAAFCTLLNGNTEGREYAELGALLDVLVVVALCLLTYNIWMTIVNRKVQKLYVSLWYFLGSLFWFPLVWIIGQRTFVSLPGLNDAIIGWFYGHNILGMWFTTVGVGLMYYLLPRLTKAPLYSHGLSMLGFWGIALFYAPTGTHHITQSPVPEWLKAIAIISSIFLLVPVLTVLTNFFMTMKGRWHMPVNDMALRFAVTSCFFYLLTCLQGPFQATRWVNWYLHFTQWSWVMPTPLCSAPSPSSSPHLFIMRCRGW